MTSEPTDPTDPTDPAAPSAPPPATAEPDAPGPSAAADPIVEHRLHPSATAIEAIRHARSAVAGMIVVVVSAGLVGGALIIAGVLVAVSIFAFVQWRTTTYSIVDGTLRHRSGVFSRRERNIPATRISALDTSRGLLQRIFGVVALNVQTAGGGKEAEIGLRAVTFAEAERLRHALGHRGSAATAAPLPEGAPTFHAKGDAVPTDSGRDAAGNSSSPAGPTFAHQAIVDDDAPVVYSMTPRELVVAALTSPSIAVVAAAAAAVLSFGSDALPDRLQRQLTSSVDDLTLTAAAIVVVVGLFVAAVISVAGTILLYGGFQVTRDDRRLRVRRGLVTERTGTIPRDRIHGVRIVESPLRQWLGYAAIEVEVAGYAGQDEVTRTLVPLIRRAEIPGLLSDVVPGLRWPEQPLQSVPSRARRRYLTAPLLTALVPSIALVVAPIGPFRAFAVLPLVVAVLVGRLEAREAGWSLSDGTLALRWRGFARTTLLADARRLQRTQMTTSPFQRRANLGTFGVRLSNSRRGQVRHLDRGVAQLLLRDTGR